MQRLLAMQKEHACIGQVRGRGLMVGVEIVDDRQAPDRLGTCPADPALARSLQQHCLRLGVILELGGRHGAVVRFLPPLIITPAEIDQVAERFQTALARALSDRK